MGLTVVSLVTKLIKTCYVKGKQTINYKHSVKVKHEDSLLKIQRLNKSLLERFSDNVHPNNLNNPRESNFYQTHTYNHRSWLKGFQGEGRQTAVFVWHQEQQN